VQLIEQFITALSQNLFVLHTSLQDEKVSSFCKLIIMHFYNSSNGCITHFAELVPIAQSYCCPSSRSA
jgi:hypothetical protein